MAAIIHSDPRPVRSPIPARPLRVIEGGRAPHRQVALYRRRRITAAIFVVALAGLALVGTHALLVAVRPAVPGANVPTGTISATVDRGPVVVVRPGDTLWSIARRLAPEGDVRATVDRLAAVHGTGPLQVSERLPVAAATGR